MNRKAIFIIFFICVSVIGFCQITEINSGTATHLLDLSVIDKNIVISGRNNYIVKSYDECNSFIPLTQPGPTTYLNRLQRIDTSISYLLSFTPNQLLLYKSIDGGYNWVQKLDTAGAFSSNISFFDSLEGIISMNSSIIRTKNGGTSWTSTVSPLAITSIMVKYGDSLICIGGSDANASGAIATSKDRGNTWIQSGGFPTPATPTGFCFLNNDTIFGVSSPGNFGAYFTKTTDGGNIWQNSPIPLFRPNGIYFRSSLEGYVVGATSQTIGVILKTNDRGQTWSTFNTGVKTTILNIAFLNDSMALLTGSDGVLLKWNYKNSMFTAIDENVQEKAGTKIFPNPVEDKLHVAFENYIQEKLKLTITNIIGQEVYSINNFDLKWDFDVAFLASGIYYLEIESKNEKKVFKMIKE
jgi:photosystem II stability/assembly factor-like uncharacterized protein